MVAALKRARFPAPDAMSGRVLEALARAGVFRLRVVVVGTVAYQTYPAILGVRLPEASTRTDDLDLAQFHSVSVAIGDAAEMSVGEILTTVDPGFKAVPYATSVGHSNVITCSANGVGKKPIVIACSSIQSRNRSDDERVSASGR